jgi:hypothetical protein
MDDGGRRCALPGCDRTIPTTDGRPERRYCTAAHRAAARQARRAAQQAEQHDGPERLAEALPWVREPVAAPRPVEAAEPGPAARPLRDRRAPRPGARALAMLGVAGILAGGYATTDPQPEPSPAPVRAAPEAEPVDAWAQRASIALTSVNQELDVLDQAEEVWRRLPEARRAVVPAPVVALQERRSALQQRRATLQSQLGAYRSLRRAQQELAVSEQLLKAVEEALADAPPAGRRSAEQEAAIAALDEQRDLRLRRRDAQRAELESLQEGVSTAARTPLPDDAGVTDRVSRDVREVVRNGGTRPAVPTPQPDVVAGRDEDDGAADPTRDAFAELRERAVEVAREARRAEAARTAVARRPSDDRPGGDAGTPGPVERADGR